LPELAVVIPTLNEVDNVPTLVARLTEVLSAVDWEAIFVDDDSPDGTAEELRRISAQNPRVRVLQRIGRSGLSSACIEGMMASSARYLAVMDADLQHDESVLPRMLETIKTTGADVVVASRHAEGGGMGDFGRRRQFLSNVGAWISRVVCRCNVSDPMSGFFLLRRELLNQVVRRLSLRGFKILVDILSSSPEPVRVVEVPHTFRARVHGASKLDVNIGLEYLLLVIEKLLGDLIPVRFTMFALVGALGVVLNVIELWVLYKVIGLSFAVSQSVAAVTAMTANFFLNNIFTYRDLRLRGWHLWSGLLSFYAACSIGALINITIAEVCMERGIPWYLAATIGLVIGSVWNYSATSVITWRKLRHRNSRAAVTGPVTAARTPAQR
jgi:dolichol-phosphate mannosyltransferase